MFQAVNISLFTLCSKTLRPTDMRQRNNFCVLQGQIIDPLINFSYFSTAAYLIKLNSHFHRVQKSPWLRNLRLYFMLPSNFLQLPLR